MGQPKYLWVGILLAVVLVQPCLSPAQLTTDGMEDARRRGALLVGVKNDFPPFGYVDDAGEWVGFDVDIAATLARALFGEPDRLRLIAVTSGGRIPFLYRGWIDIIIATMTVTDARRHVLEFSDPYFMSGSLLLVRNDSAISGLADLSGKDIAVVSGSVQVEDLEQIAPDARRKTFDSVSQAVAALRGGKVDAFAQDDVLILKLAKDHSDLRFAGTSFLPRPYAIAVRKGDKTFIEWVNRQLAAMKADGTSDRIWDKHFGDIEENLIKP
jgi:ABC-type amino acid transport substrate-binding protein